MIRRPIQTHVRRICKLDVANNLIYNACTNALQLSNAGNSETVPLTEMTASPALIGGVTNVARLFPSGLAFMGMKKVFFLDSANDQNYYFIAPSPSVMFGKIN